MTVAGVTFIAPWGKFDLQVKASGFSLLSTGKVKKLYHFTRDDVKACMRVEDEKKKLCYFVVSLGVTELTDALSTSSKKGISVLAFSCKVTEKFALGKVLLGEMSSPLTEAVRGLVTGQDCSLVEQVLTTLVKHTFPGELETPSPNVFTGSNGGRYVMSYVKANQGLLFPLTSGLVFVKKPLLYLSHENIDSISNSRAVPNSRSFDLQITLQDGSSHEFGMIPSAEQACIADYLKQVMKQRAAAAAAAESSSDDDSSEDDDTDASSGSDASSGGEDTGKNAGEGEDTSDSEGSDYDPAAPVQDADISSSGEDEYDSGYETGSSDDESDTASTTAPTDEVKEQPKGAQPLSTFVKLISNPVQPVVMDLQSDEDDASSDSVDIDAFSAV
jgi:hypothetical protein